MGLKEATAEKHKLAERMPFNGRMFKGELTNDEYIKYLKSQLAIFTVLEQNFEFPSDGLKRVEAVQMDLVALGANQLELYTDPATENYVEYLRGLSQDDAMAHVYLKLPCYYVWWTDDEKANTPGPGHMYDFKI
jgi:heme oxygenase